MFRQKTACGYRDRPSKCQRPSSLHARGHYGNGAEIAANANELIVHRQRIPLRNFYQAVAVGKPVVIISSAGFVEVAVNGGSAAQRLKLTPGTRVELR